VAVACASAGAPPSCRAAGIYGAGAGVASDLHVDTTALRSSGDRLIEFAKTVQDLDGAALAARRGDYGHAGLAGAAAGFAERWARGLQATAGDVGDNGRALLSVAGSFEAADAAAASAAQDLPIPP
jgi:hypothetical protein